MYVYVYICIFNYVKLNYVIKILKIVKLLLSKFIQNFKISELKVELSVLKTENNKHKSSEFDKKKVCSFIKSIIFNTSH